jgi:type III secretion protein R
MSLLKRFNKLVLLFVMLLFASAAAYAQEPSGDAIPPPGITVTTHDAPEEPTTPDASNPLEQPEPPTPNVVTQMSVLAGLAILPFAILLLTSYMKIVIVLSLLRNALGVQTSPPNQVLNGIALLMTVYVMFPTGLAMYQAGESVLKDKAPPSMFSGEGATYIIQVADVSKEPLREFLQRNTVGKHISSFYQLAYRSFPEPFRTALKPTDFIVIVPAFITSQLKAAFEIGVLVYLPFFVIDLVVSNILLAMGMMMLSPLTIALPLKLLLLVMVDGWTLIIQGLVLTFR